MGKKISETKLVETYGDPKVSWGKKKTLASKPTLVFTVGNNQHITIFPDDAWTFQQMFYQSEGNEDLHTSYGDITFDEWHLTDNQSNASVFVNLEGKILPQSDGPQTMRERAIILHGEIFA